MSGYEILELVDIFADLNSEQLAQVHAICCEEKYNGGETIFEESSPSDDIYIILDGEIEIVVNASHLQDSFNQQELRRIALLERGQSFGEIALVDQGLRSTGAVCRTETCKLLVIKRSDLLNLFRNNLEIGFQVMTNLAADLCLKIRRTNFLAREQLLYHPK